MGQLDDKYRGIYHALHWSVSLVLRWVVMYVMSQEVAVPLDH
jgi:hypothetical protein